MALEQRRNNVEAAKKKSRIIEVDIESGEDLPVVNHKKYLNHNRLAYKQHALVLFLVALAWGLLLNRSHFASSTVVIANNVSKKDDARHNRNKQLQKENKYGFTLNAKEDLPPDWVKWGFSRIRRRLKCDEYVVNEEKPLPSMEYWQIILDAYNKEVDGSYKFDELVPPTQGYRFNNEAGAQPYYAKVTKGKKDRGLFASREIKEGELVHDGTKSDVVFPDAMAWRRFVLALPRKAACDITEWSWTQQLEENGPMKILSAINISVLMNMGMNPEKINAVPKSSTSSLFYATQDIKKGEEILTNYEMYDTRFDLAGLGR